MVLVDLDDLALDGVTAAALQSYGHGRAGAIA
jgi:hypothetical protein